MARVRCIHHRRPIRFPQGQPFLYEHPASAEAPNVRTCRNPRSCGSDCQAEPPASSTIAWRMAGARDQTTFNLVFAPTGCQMGE